MLPANFPALFSATLSPALSVYLCVNVGLQAAAPPTPTGAFNQRFEALFPCPGALGCAVCFAPSRLSRFICARVWGRGVLPAALPALFSATLRPALSVFLCVNVGSQGLLVVRLPAPFVPHPPVSVLPRLRESSLPRCPPLPLLPVWMYVSFLSTWCRTSLPFYFLSVLVVRGGAVCLPMLPSWFSPANSFSNHKWNFIKCFFCIY